MKNGYSVWLDTLRVFATLVVVFSHLAYPRFSEGRYSWFRDLNFGSDAVIVFFVVSGSVIAYAADRDKTLLTYAFNRLTRLWSVMIPALILTYSFDFLGFTIDPNAYPSQFYHQHDALTLFLRGVSFSNEFDFPGRIRLGTNGPLWSLSYEAAYYVCFGIAVFIRGLPRVFLLIVTFAIFGPRILMLAPSWVLGVWLWNTIKKPTFRLGLYVGWIFAISPLILYVLCLWIEIPRFLTQLTVNDLGIPYPKRVLGFSDEFIWNALVGVLTSIHLLGMSRVLQDMKLNCSVIRWAAGASFSIYVTHYPSLHLADAIIPAGIPARDFLLLGFAFLVGLSFAAAFERNLHYIRAKLHQQKLRVI